MIFIQYQKQLILNEENEIPYALKLAPSFIFKLISNLRNFPSQQPEKRRLWLKQINHQ